MAYYDPYDQLDSVSSQKGSTGYCSSEKKHIEKNMSNPNVFFHEKLRNCLRFQTWKRMCGGNKDGTYHGDLRVPSPMPRP